MRIAAPCIAITIAALSLSNAFAQSSKPITVILIPGAGGATPSDFLIRNEKAFASQGLQTKVATSAVAAANAIRESGGKAVLVGMSAGTPMVAQAIAQGAPVAGAVFVAGTLVPGMAQRSVAATLGDPGKLPPSLVVHHRQDRCPMTPPSGVSTFVKWSGGKAKAAWIDGGNAGGNPCGPMSAHGFIGQDQAAVAAIAAFAKAQ
jgi:predicted alpha/beta hydrolase family esterase